jgi:hypothetical protein
MWKFIGKTLAGMVLTKEAQQAAGDLAQTAFKHAIKTKAAPEPIIDLKQHAVEQVKQQAAAIITPTRAELIRQAMQVRAAKQSLLNDLDDADRAKLVAAAMRAFLNEGKPKE